MVIATNYVVTRKEHRCWGCEYKFPPKSSMVVRKSVDEGVIVSTYWCETCNAFLKKHQKDFEEGVNFGEFRGEEMYEEFKRIYI